MAKSVRIIAPSRIHFGLLSVDRSDAQQTDTRQFGGVGVMLDKPCLELRVEKASELSAEGPLADRALEFIRLWQKHTGCNDAVHCRILQAPPEHVGLGLGTQMGLSVAWALQAIFELNDISIEALAASVHRGRRSAVGTYGFDLGGMIVEDGKRKGDVIGRLRERIQLPEDWCVMLFRAGSESGLAGDAEVSAFGALPAVEDELKAKLRRELYERLMPAAKDGDFPTFAESVYQYGYAAGEAFAAEQGGPFVSSQVAELVDFLRDVGVPGVGQSSWGPTVFAWFANQGSAQCFLDEFVTSNGQLPANLADDIIVTPVARCGAQRFLDAD